MQAETMQRDTIHRDCQLRARLVISAICISSQKQVRTLTYSNSAPVKFQKLLPFKILFIILHNVNKYDFYPN